MFKLIKKDTAAVVIISVFLTALMLAFFGVSDTVKAKSERKNVSFEGKTLKIPWNHNYFSKSANAQNIDLAVAGLVLSAASAKSEGECESTMKTLGFNEMDSKHYGIIDWLNHPARTFGVQKQKLKGKGKYIIAACFRGTPGLISKEFVDDLKAQKDGFLPSGKTAIKELKNYIDDLKKKKKYKSIKKKNTLLYIVGHSYGGAVSGQVARLSGKIASKKNSFVYTYASPNYNIEKDDPADFKNVFNYVNKRDIIPLIPIANIAMAWFENPIIKVIKNIYLKVGQIVNYKIGDVQKGQGKRYADAYRKIRGKEYNEVRLLKEHMVETYMALLLSGLDSRKLDKYFKSSKKIKYKLVSQATYKEYDSETKKYCNPEIVKYSYDKNGYVKRINYAEDGESENETIKTVIKKKKRKKSIKTSEDGIRIIKYDNKGAHPIEAVTDNEDGKETVKYKKYKGGIPSEIIHESSADGMYKELYNIELYKDGLLKNDKTSWNEDRISCTLKKRYNSYGLFIESIYEENGRIVPDNENSVVEYSYNNNGTVNTIIVKHGEDKEVIKLKYNNKETNKKRYSLMINDIVQNNEDDSCYFWH